MAGKDSSDSRDWSADSEMGDNNCGASDDSDTAVADPNATGKNSKHSAHSGNSVDAE